MISKTTIWTTEDGKQHDEEQLAQNWEKRLHLIDDANRKVMSGCSLGKALKESGCVMLEKRLFKMFAGKVVSIPRDDDPFGKYRFSRITPDNTIEMAREGNCKLIILGKTELAWFLNHPCNK